MLLVTSRGLIGKYHCFGTLALKMEIVCPKYWYLLTSPHSATTQKKSMDTFKVVRNSRLVSEVNLRISGRGYRNILHTTPCSVLRVIPPAGFVTYNTSRSSYKLCYICHDSFLVKAVLHTSRVISATGSGPDFQGLRYKLSRLELPKDFIQCRRKTVGLWYNETTYYGNAKWWKTSWGAVFNNKAPCAASYVTR
jgi:hypothetical protein